MNLFGLVDFLVRKKRWGMYRRSKNSSGKTKRGKILGEKNGEKCLRGKYLAPN